MRETKWERCCDSKCDKNKEVRMTESHETRFTGVNNIIIIIYLDLETCKYMNTGKHLSLCRY